MAKKSHIDDEDVILDGVSTMMDNRSKHCRNCLHYHNGSRGYGTCDAFPKGIPTAIWIGDKVHDKRMFRQTNTLVFKGSE